MNCLIFVLICVGCLLSLNRWNSISSVSSVTYLSKLFYLIFFRAGEMLSLKISIDLKLYCKFGSTLIFRIQMYRFSMLALQTRVHIDLYNTSVEFFSFLSPLDKNCSHLGKPEKEYEMIVKRTLQSICLLTVHPNTTTSVIIQVRCSNTEVEIDAKRTFINLQL